MDLKTRKYYYNRCEPRGALAPDDPRRVDLDAPTPDGVLPRGRRWVEWLASRVTLSDRPVCQLVTAVPGTGVSTLLLALADHLGRPQGVNLLAVAVDAREALDLRAPLDATDLLLAVVTAVEAAVAGDERENAETDYLRRFWTGLVGANPDLEDRELAVARPDRLLVEMRLRPRLRERVREAVGRAPGDFLAAARDELVLLEDRARRAGRAGIVVLVDSLERLQGVGARGREVLASAESLFGRGATALELPVHVVCTAPAALVPRGIEGLALLVVARPAGTSEGAAGGAARELVRRRVPDAALAELLGPRAEARIERLIAFSGGVPGDLVGMLQAVVADAAEPLTDDAFRRVLGELEDEYRRRPPAGAGEWLARVAQGHDLALRNDADAETAGLALANGLVVPYPDGFDVHPAVAARG